MRIRTRIYLGCLGVLALGAGALGAFYAVIVSSPSHFGELEKSQAEVVRRVHAMVRPAGSGSAASMAQPGSPASATVPPASQARPLIHDEVSSQGYPTGFFNAMGKLETRLPLEADGTSHSADLDRFQNMLTYRSGSIITWAAYFLDDVAPDETAARSIVFAAVDTYREKYPDLAGRLPQDRLDHPAPIAAALRERLDDIEAFLDRVPYDRFPDFDEFDASFAYRFHFEKYAKLAVIRALEANDPVRAERILTADLRLFQRIRVATFPEDMPCPFGYDSLCFLAGYDCLTPAALGRIQKIIDEMHLSAKQIEDLRKAHALRAARRYQRYRQNNLFSGVGNTWHWFYNGRPEKTVMQAVWPVLDRQMEDLAKAWVRDDPSEIRTCEKSVEATRRLTNIGLSPLQFYYGASASPSYDASRYIPYIPSDESRIRIHGAYVNPFIDLNRLILASIRYRRERGAWPESIHALGTQYLASDLLRPDAPYLFFHDPVEPGLDIPVYCSVRREGRTIRIGTLYFPPRQLVSDDLRALIKP